MMLAYLASIFALSALFSALVLKFLIPRLFEKGIVGTDVNKKRKPQVAEMGGIGIVSGFAFGVLLAVFFHTFVGLDFRLDFALAALISIFILAFVGFVDDLLDIPQAVKAFLPLLAGIPLIAVRAAGSTAMSIPFFGTIDFGLVYLFILIPVGIAVASNLTNMLAGFNGMEAGMGMVLLLAASLAALNAGSVEALVIYVPMLGALAGFFILNKYPARVFPGDIGTLVIGATLAAGAIIGNFESIAALLMALYVADFFVKAKSGFPHTPGQFRAGKLYAPKNEIRGLVHVPMRVFNGIGEQELVLILIIAQEIVALLVLIAFLHVKVF